MSKFIYGIPIGGNGQLGLKVEDITGTEVALTFANNVEYRCADLITSLSIIDFEAGPQNIMEEWSIIFTTGDSISVDYPDTVHWALAEPVWEANKTYWLSFIPFNDKYLGIWTVMA